MRDPSTVPYRTFHYSAHQQQSFREGSLMCAWASAYPDIFDQDDFRLAAAQRDYHFFEWLAAILLFHTEGYLSLVEQYEFKCHKRKQEKLRHILASSPVLDLVLRRNKGAQCPDLFVYKPDGSDWFFAEVKGPGDRLGDAERALFSSLRDCTGSAVRIITFKPIGG